MGYLDNSTVTVDAILTNKGRELLAKGQKLNIVKFALSDDEIDYDLWNPAHTLGTNYYGAVIENMPVLEALPDETQMMKYKLVTLPKDVTGIPIISVGITSIVFTTLGQPQVVTPTVVNLAGANSTLGYTAILSDASVAYLEVGPTGTVNRSAAQRSSARTTTEPGTAATSQQSAPLPSTFMSEQTNVSFADDQLGGTNTVTVIGSSFTITPKPTISDETVARATLTIIGNETGGFLTIPISVSVTAKRDIGTGFSTLGGTPSSL